MQLRLHLYYMYYFNQNVGHRKRADYEKERKNWVREDTRASIRCFLNFF